MNLSGDVQECPASPVYDDSHGQQDNERDMKITDTYRHTRAGLGERLGQRNQASREDVPNVIRFPGTRNSRRQPEQRGARSFTLLLGQALRQTLDSLRRFTGSPNQVSVQPKPRPGTAPAAHYYPALRDSKLPRHGGGPVHKRMSA